MLPGMFRESRGNTSDGINSAMLGIVRQVNSLENPSIIDVITILTKPLDTVFVEFIAPMGIECLVTFKRNRFARVSVMKFAVAHVSNNARALILFCSQSRTPTIALINSCGDASVVNAVRLMVGSVVIPASHSLFAATGFDVLDRLVLAYESECRSVLWRFWQIVQFENLHGASRWERKQL